MSNLTALIRLAATVLLLAVAFELQEPPAHSSEEAVCEWACDEQAPCDLECVREDYSERTTCGGFGICDAPPAAPSCSYVPITGWTFCHIDNDSHFFWYSLEMEHEALHSDANGNPACPQKWIQVVFDEATCFGGTDPLDCCEGDLNLPREFCHFYMSGDFCHR
jgi:hypothetical protein